MPVSTQARMDGGTGALKSTLRFSSAAGGAPSPLSRGGGSGTAARSRATYRRANQKAVLAQRIAALELVEAALSDEEKEAAVAALKAALRRAAQPEGALLALMLAPREASAAPSEAVAPSEGPGGAAWNWEQRRATLWLQEAALEQQFAVLMQREAAILLIEIEMGLSGLGNTKYGIIK